MIRGGCTVLYRLFPTGGRRGRSAPYVSWCWEKACLSPSVLAEGESYPLYGDVLENVLMNMERLKKEMKKRMSVYMIETDIDRAMDQGRGEDRPGRIHTRP